MQIHSKNCSFNYSLARREVRRKSGDSAVSPVVGVMLMLVVVIIIAAVVSGFSGGFVSSYNKNKAPSLAMDLEIANSGNWENSYFKGTVTSTSAPISTQNLKIVTSWTKTLGNMTTIPGGATTTPGIVNFNVIYDTHGGMGYDLWRLTVPYGYGPGVGNRSGNLGAGNVFWNIDGGGNEAIVQAGTEGNSSWWGNYYLQPGTVFLSRPFGGSVSSQAYGASYSATSHTFSVNQFASGYGVSTKFQYTYSSIPYTPGLCYVNSTYSSSYSLSMEGQAATRLNQLFCRIPVPISIYTGPGAQCVDSLCSKPAFFGMGSQNLQY